MMSVCEHQAHRSIQLIILAHILRNGHFVIRLSFLQHRKCVFSVEENVLIIPLVQLTRKFRIEFVIFEYNNDKRENEQKNICQSTKQKKM